VIDIGAHEHLGPLGRITLADGKGDGDRRAKHEDQYRQGTQDRAATPRLPNPVGRRPGGQA